MLFSSSPIKLHRLVSWGGGATSETASDVTGMQVLYAGMATNVLAAFVTSLESGVQYGTRDVFPSDGCTRVFC